MDVVDAAKRSLMMAGIRSKNTSPEMIVRKFLHAHGFRYRLHSNRLPGRPDLVLPKYKVAIFVHGCFWHRHQFCKYSTNPATNVEKWKLKFQTNIDRDKRNVADLVLSGWRVIVVWECDLRMNSENRLMKLTEEIRET